MDEVDPTRRAEGDRSPPKVGQRTPPVALGGLPGALAAARTEHGFSTRTLARALTNAGFPISHQRVSDYERGTLPTERYVTELEQVLGLDEGALVEKWREARRGQLRRRRGSEAPAPPMEGAPEDASAQSPPGARRPVVRVFAPAGFAFLAVVVIVIIALRATGDSDEPDRDTAAVRQTTDDSVTGPAGVSCVPIGQGSSSFGPSFVEAFEDAGGSRRLGCAINGIHRWGPGQIQDLRGGERGRGAIMAIDPSHVVVVTGDAWIAYENAIGPGSTGPVAGYPVTVDEQCPGGRLMQLAGGSAGPGGLFRRDDNGLWIWVYGPIWRDYLERGGPHGELGLPTQITMTSPDAVRQRFDGGEIVADTDMDTPALDAPSIPGPLCSTLER